MHIRQIPIFSDNYAYLVIDEGNGVAAAIDPAEPGPVLEVVKQMGVAVTHVLCTHHHFDHAGGNQTIVDHYPDAIIAGGQVDAERIPGCSLELDAGDPIQIGTLIGHTLFVPCHTRGHVAYLFDDALFCGDTLFVGGCGRFFEGDAAQMHHALNTVFAELPHETKVFCAHEYTISNLRFASQVDPENTAVAEKLSWAQQRRAANQPTVPSTIAEELTFNPFMRVDQPAIQAATTSTDAVTVMARLREMKNNL